MSYVYRHIRLDKNEVFYVGIGSDIKGSHSRAYNKNKRSLFWKDIVSKTQYRVEILFDNLTTQEALEKEIEFIKLYGRRNLKTGTLANLTDGGGGCDNRIISQETRLKQSKIAKARYNSGWKQSEETLKRQSLKVKEGYANGRIASMQGKNHTEETREKIRRGHIGKKRSEETIRKHSQLLLKLSREQVNQIENLLLVKTSTEIARMFNIAQSTVSKIKNKKYYKFT